MTEQMADEVRDTLRFIFACYMGGIYDDPFDFRGDDGPDEFKKIEDVGRFLGIDIWNDRDVMRELSGDNFSDIELDVLKRIAHGERDASYMKGR